MSAWSNRNLAAMLKEQRTAPKAVAVAGEDGEAPKRPVVSIEPKTQPSPAAPAATPEVTPTPAPTPAEAVAAPAAAEPTPAPAPTPAAAPAPAPAVVYTAFGPVSMPEALARLVLPAEFRFTGAVEPPKPVAVPPPPQPVAAAPLKASPAAAPAPIVETTVTSSSELPHTRAPYQQHHQYQPQPQPQQQQPQWRSPQHVYNPHASYYTPSYEGARPYGGELGSVPRYYSTERQYNAQPYHPTYQTPQYRGGYSSGAAPYGGYGDAYPSYYPGQAAPYMGGRLQARPPYYPPRDVPQQQYQQQQQI